MSIVASRFRALLGYAVMAALLAGVLSMSAGSALAAEEEAVKGNPLKALLEKTGLKFSAIDEESWRASFEGKDGKVINVFITYNNEKKKFAMIFTTVVDKDDKYEYGVEVLTECMKLNNDFPACKFCLDYDNGDIDCQTELLLSTLTPEALAMHINLVAALADEHSEKLNSLVR